MVQLLHASLIVIIFVIDVIHYCDNIPLRSMWLPWGAVGYNVIRVIVIFDNNNIVFLLFSSSCFHKRLGCFEWCNMPDKSAPNHFSGVVEAPTNKTSSLPKKKKNKQSDVCRHLSRLHFSRLYREHSNNNYYIRLMSRSKRVSIDFRVYRLKIQYHIMTSFWYDIALLNVKGRGCETKAYAVGVEHRLPLAFVRIGYTCLGWSRR